MTPSPHEGDTHDWGDYINNSSRGDAERAGTSISATRLSLSFSFSLSRSLSLSLRDTLDPAVKDASK